jgi:hypothetical protein
VIVSNSRKFIFLHLRKCAGSSLTDYLSNFARRPGDHVVGAFVDRFIKGSLPFSDLFKATLPPYHFSTIRYLLQSRDLLGALNVNYKSKYFHLLGTNPEHCSLDKILPLLKYSLSAYDIIICVRNPLERLISDYHYLLRSLFLPDSLTFSDFTLSHFVSLYVLPESRSHYIPHNRRLEDLLGASRGSLSSDKMHFIRFSELEKDLSLLSIRLFNSKLKVPLQIHKSSGSSRLSHSSASIPPYLLNQVKAFFRLEYDILERLSFLPPP